MIEYQLRRPVKALRVPLEDEVTPDDFMTGHGFIAGWLSLAAIDEWELTDRKGYLVVLLNGGSFVAGPGDWIVCYDEVNGHFTRVSDRIFTLLYEEAPTR